MRGNDIISNTTEARKAGRNGRRVVGERLRLVATFATRSGSLRRGVAALAAWLGNLRRGAATLAAKSGSLRWVVATLAAKSGSLLWGVATLAARSGSLRWGVATLATRLGSLRWSAATLAARLGNLRQGVATLAAGSGSLRRGVATISIRKGSLLRDGWSVGGDWSGAVRGSRSPLRESTNREAQIFGACPAGKVRWRVKTFTQGLREPRLAASRIPHPVSRSPQSATHTSYATAKLG